MSMGTFYLFVLIGLTTGGIVPWLLAVYFWQARPEWDDDLGFGAWLRQEHAVLCCCIAATVTCIIPLLFH